MTELVEQQNDVAIELAVLKRRMTELEQQSINQSLKTAVRENAKNELSYVFADYSALLAVSEIAQSAHNRESAEFHFGARITATRKALNRLQPLAGNAFLSISVQTRLRKTITKLQAHLGMIREQIRKHDAEQRATRAAISTHARSEQLIHDLPASLRAYGEKTITSATQIRQCVAAIDERIASYADELTDTSLSESRAGHIQSILAERERDRATLLEWLPKFDKTAVAPVPVPSVPIHDHDWVILGDKADAYPAIEQELRDYVQRHPGKAQVIERSIERLHRLFDLQPDRAHRGRFGLRGYFAFEFEAKQIAIFDCPMLGNALYLVHGHWEAFARKSKAELRQDIRSGAARRIVHNSTWFERLQQALNASPGSIADTTR